MGEQLQFGLGYRFQWDRTIRQLLLQAQPRRFRSLPGASLGFDAGDKKGRRSVLLLARDNRYPLAFEMALKSAASSRQGFIDAADFQPVGNGVRLDEEWARVEKLKG